jgi:hypothetical protein
MAVTRVSAGHTVLKTVPDRLGCHFLGRTPDRRAVSYSAIRRGVGTNGEKLREKDSNLQPAG